MKVQFLLKGFYNAGNLGDDILMISSFKIIKNIFPNASIWVDTSHSNQNIYVTDLLPKAKIFNRSIYDAKFDYIIYGGGGLFFNFKKNSPKWLILNPIYKILKKVPFKDKYVFNYSTPLIGFGLGYGPYKLSSSNFINHMELSKQFEFLSVRDKSSYNIIKHYNKQVFLHTDLAFNPLIKNLFRRSGENKQNYVGIIFRDWTYYDNKIEELIKIYNRLSDQGKKVKFISFNPHNDKKGIKLLKQNKIPVLEYNPKFIEKFLANLNEAEIIISQRAHGIILSSLMRIPYIGIEIEPKIKNINQLIPNSGIVVSLEELDEIPKIISKIKDYNFNFENDINLNENKVNILIEDLKLFFKSKAI